MSRPYMTLFTALVGLAACTGESTVQTGRLHGAWRLVTMQLISADQDTVKVPVQESLFVFGGGYYSIAYAFGNERSPTYAERWHPSEGEKAARFSSLIVNAGSYRIDGSDLYGRPLFALAPEFVGGRADFSFQFVADTLELTWQRSVAFDGLEYPSAGTVTLLRLVRAG